MGFTTTPTSQSVAESGYIEERQKRQAFVLGVCKLRLGREAGNFN